MNEIRNQGKVNIILPTYNGEKYIGELLDSILMQTYDNIDIYIRDDGSTDRTMNIVHMYSNQNKSSKNIIIMEDEKGNLGYPKCFLEIIQNVKNAPFYAFADQDDVWDCKKIERAVGIIAKYNETKKPVLYFCNYDICDAKLNVKGCPQKPLSGQGIPIYKLLFGGTANGFVMVFNRYAKEMAFAKNIKYIPSQDAWLQRVVAITGGISVFDEDYIGAKYRRNEGAVTSDTTKKLAFFLWRLKTFVFGHSFESIQKGIYYLMYQYADILSIENKKCLQLFSKKGNVLKKIFFPHRLRTNITDEIFLRMMFLFRKI